MQEFAAGATAAPDFDRIPVLSHGGVNLCDQGWQDVAGEQVEIVVRAVQVRRHHRYEIAAVLPAICLAQFESGDLCDGIPLVRWLERAAQQAGFRHRLGREARIDAGGTEEH